MTRPRVALFLDRDGILNEPVWDPHVQSTESPLDPTQVELTDGAALAVGRAQRAGLDVVVVSNQPAAAKGVVGVDAIHAVHERVLDMLAASDAAITHSYLCLHHPSGVLPDLTMVCECRKPAPGMLRRAATDLTVDLDRSWLIGDTDADLGAARQAGLVGVVIVENPLSAHRRSGRPRSADAVTSTLPAAVDVVLERMRASGTLPARLS